MRRLLFGLVAAAPLALVVAASAGGCGGTTRAQADASADHPHPPSTGWDGATLDAAYHPDASCLVTIDTPPIGAAAHLDEGTPITYGSNPPCGGPHYPRWAMYGAYTAPIPPPYWVHDLEHGAIVLLYKCAGDCPDTVKALRQVRDALPDDPLCTSRGEGVRVRVVIAPAPTLDVPVAAAAWSWTYKAQCVDVPSLQAFVKDHYGQGEEATCGNGQSVF